jgi:hypothetical protein
MNTDVPQNFMPDFLRDLQEHLELCRRFLALATEENQALRSPAPWSADLFHAQRMHLLPKLESVLIKLRSCRQIWQQAPPEERARCGEAGMLLRDIQNLLPRIFLLDRENQQEMLRRGLLPASHLPAAAISRPNFVANLYQRNTAA